MGLFCSFKSARDYEKCAAIIDRNTIHKSDTSFIQYVADNVDHNICTLDGHGTFHGMGIIATCTPTSRIKRTIPKVKVSMDDISKVAGIHIKYHPGLTQNNDLTYHLPQDLRRGFKNYNLDILWRCSVLFRRPTPSWSGTMQTVHKGSHPGISSVTFLPMIDMNPSDPSCIYSTLNFVSSHAQTCKRSL